MRSQTHIVHPSSSREGQTRADFRRKWSHRPLPLAAANAAAAATSAERLIHGINFEDSAPRVLATIEPDPYRSDRVAPRIGAAPVAETRARRRQTVRGRLCDAFASMAVDDAVAGHPGAALTWAGHGDSVYACGFMSRHGCTGCDETYGVLAHTCKERVCEYCLRSRMARIVGSLHPFVVAAVDAGAIPWHLTVTLPDLSFKGMLDAHATLSASYAQMRTRVAWKSLVDGTVASIEVVRGKGSGKWHVHMHVLVLARAAPERLRDGTIPTVDDLRHLWTVVSPGSVIAAQHVRRVSVDPKALLELLKYSVKPTELAFDRATSGRSILRPLADVKSDLRELYGSLYRRRLIRTSGSLYKRGAVEDEDQDEDREQSPSRISCGACGHDVVPIVARQLDANGVMQTRGLVVSRDACVPMVVKTDGRFAPTVLDPALLMIAMALLRAGHVTLSRALLVLIVKLFLDDRTRVPGWYRMVYPRLDVRPRCLDPHYVLGKSRREREAAMVAGHGVSYRGVAALLPSGFRRRSLPAA